MTTYRNHNSTNGLNPEHIKDHHIKPMVRGGDVFWCPEIKRHIKVVVLETGHKLGLFGRDTELGLVALMGLDEMGNRALRLLFTHYEHPMSMEQFIELVREKILVVTTKGDGER